MDRIRLDLPESLGEAWAEQERRLGRRGLPPPYWAVAWPGGRALARYVLDEPAVVRGKHVLDFGSGSGICAIAAALSGAARVEAADIDPHARAAIGTNAALNAVSVATIAEDLIGAASRWEVVLAGDLWYERFFAQRATAWLRAIATQGASVLLGDSGRAHFPRTGVERVASYRVECPASLEPAGTATAGVWRMAC